MMRPKHKFEIVGLERIGPLDRQIRALDSVRRQVEKAENRISNMRLASRDVMCDSSRSGWICLQVKAGAELMVEEFLTKLDVEVFIACHPEKKFRKRGKEKTTPRRAIISGYVLVRCAYDLRAFVALSEIPEVISIIGGTASPLMITDKNVNRFKAMSDDGSLSTLALDPGIKAGDKVFIRAGMLADFNGEILSRDGASVVVLIGNSRVSMPLAYIEKL